MNFSEYLQLDEALRASGTSLKKELGLNEAEGDVIPTTSTSTTKTPEPASTTPTPVSQSTDKLNQSSGNVLTRSGRLKNKLNGVAKKIQQQLSDQVLKKYLPKILETEKAQLAKILEGTKGVTDIAKKKELIDTQTKGIRTALDQQYTMIDNAVNKFLSNSTATVTKKITSSAVNDKNKLLLTNYWTLLSTQLAMNASMYIVKQRSQLIDEVFKMDKESAKAQKALLLAAQIQKENETKATIEKLKTQVIEASKALDAEKAVNAAAPTVITKDAKYTYTNSKGESQIVIATGEPAVAGEANVAFKSGSKMSVPVANLKPYTEEKSVAETPEEKPATEKPAETAVEEPK